MRRESLASCIIPGILWLTPATIPCVPRDRRSPSFLYRFFAGLVARLCSRSDSVLFLKIGRIAIFATVALGLLPIVFGYSALISPPNNFPVRFPIGYGSYSSRALDYLVYHYP